MRKLTPDKLPFPYRTEPDAQRKDDGFYVDLRPDGTVSRIELWRYGSPLSEVLIAADARSARYTRHQVWCTGEDGFREDLADLDGSPIPPKEHAALAPEDQEGLVAYQQLSRWLRWHSLYEMKLQSQGTPFCAFCQKSQKEVRKLIAGPTSYICNECIKLCHDIIEQEEKG